MTESDLRNTFLNLQKPVLEMAIKLGVVFVMILWCFRIVEPFVLLIAWGIIVAVALYPVFCRVRDGLGGRTKLAATLLTLLLVSTLIIPTVMLTESLVEGAQALVDAGESGELVIPPPPADAGSIAADEVTADGLSLRQRLTGALRVYPLRTWPQGPLHL